SATNSVYQLNYNSKTSSLTSAVLFTANTSATSANEKQLQLSGVATNGSSVEWTSSNSKVATVSSTGLVTAVAAGTAKITCKAVDGSNKKNTVNVKVIVPASDISVAFKDDQQQVGYGKSATAMATIGSGYGKATINKLSWTVDVVDKNGNAVSNNSTIKNKKLITINNGKVSVNSQIVNYLSSPVSNYYYAKVTAKTTDGTGLSATNKIRIWYPTGKMQMSRFYNSGEGYYYAFIDATGLSATNWPTVTCSTPDVAYGIAEYNGNSGTTGEYVIVIYPLKSGTAKFTVKASDGSNVSHSFSIRVN
ncbi:MAG: Ig-like domain-containing protein, partial [Butyrivibrio sp.]|nr:Ig-like domain-containing protein [Butyrivibrio sp.]